MSYYIKNKGSKFHAFRSKLIDTVFKPLSAESSFDGTPKRILVIDNGHIGDFVMDSFAYREIKRVYPSAHVTAIVSNLAKPLAEKNKHIDKVIAMDFFWRKGHRDSRCWKDYKNVLDMIREGEYDLGIALNGRTVVTINQIRILAKRL